jgi:hypothetical protein
VSSEKVEKGGRKYKKRGKGENEKTEAIINKQ